jgi:hypothetical protein
MKKRLASISAAVLASVPLPATAAAGGHVADVLTRSAGEALVGRTLWISHASRDAAGEIVNGRPDQAPWRLLDRVAPTISVAH